jgi:hypothetical protein
VEGRLRAIGRRGAHLPGLLRRQVAGPWRYEGIVLRVLEHGLRSRERFIGYVSVHSRAELAAISGQYGDPQQSAIRDAGDPRGDARALLDGLSAVAVAEPA